MPPDADLPQLVDDHVLVEHRPGGHGDLGAVVEHDDPEVVARVEPGHQRLERLRRPTAAGRCIEPLRSSTTWNVAGARSLVGDQVRRLQVEQYGDLVGRLVGHDVDVELCGELHGLPRSAAWAA